MLHRSIEAVRISEYGEMFRYKFLQKTPKSHKESLSHHINTILIVYICDVLFFSERKEDTKATFKF